MNIQMRKGLITLNLMLMITFLITSTALALDLEKSTVGVKLGFRLPGTVEVDDVDLDSDSGITFGGFIDQKLTPALYGGAFLDLSKFSVEGSDVTQLDLGVSLKGLISPVASSFVYRPGIGLGFGVADIESLEDAATLFVANFFVEAIYFREGSIPWFGEVGFTLSSGGTDDVDVSSGPIFFIRGGYLF